MKHLLTDANYLLFDPDHMQSVLESCIGSTRAGLGDVRETRVHRYWPVGDDGLSIEWSFKLGDAGTQRIYGRSPYLPEHLGCAACEPSVTRHGLQGLCAAVPETSLLIHTPDRDPLLPKLKTLLGRVQASDLLHETECSDSDNLDVSMISYRAGRRATLLFKSKTGTRWIGKLFRDQRGKRLVKRHLELLECLATSERVTAPRPCSDNFVENMNMAMFDWSPTRTIQDSSRSPTDCVCDAFEAVARLHDCGMRNLPERKLEDEVNTVRRWERVLSSAGASCVTAYRELITRLVDFGLSVDDSVRSTIHRDLYQAQIGMTEERCTIFDLDTLSLGHPAVDIGNFLAHLAFASLEENGHVNADPAGWLDRYEQTRGCSLDHHAVRFFYACSLVRMCAVHDLRNGKNGLGDQLLDAARAALAERHRLRLVIP